MQLLILLFVLLCGPFSLIAKPLDISIHAEAVLLINADTGAVLYEKNARKLMHPASITKVATALYTLEKAGDQLDVKIIAEQDALASVSKEKKRRSNYTLPSYWLIPDASIMGIKKGEELSLQDLLYGLMLVSGDDAANVIAQHVSGTIPVFMQELNAYLKQLGCHQTNFCNPHGLYDPKHQTTAYDIAIMMREALKNPMLRKIMSTTNYTRPKTNKQEASVMVQTNKLIRKGKFYYSKAIGGKTGYLSHAGQTLVVAAQHEGRTLIAVLLKCKTRDELFVEATRLFEAAFKQPKVQRVLIKAGVQKHQLDLPGAASPINTHIAEDVKIEYYPAEEPQLKCFLYWNNPKLPIAKDQVVGELRIQNEEGTLLQTVPLLSQEEVKGTWLWRLCHFSF